MMGRVRNKTLLNIGNPVCGSPHRVEGLLMLVYMHLSGVLEDTLGSVHIKM